ncbi:flagellar hook-basal body complex protein FliE [Salinimonas sediminis]|uniref:Flagellar hook-basal body complex protein FliE n=1 Tax=Salinimonas sediminis TaxID=2303538 RepID=A0A346NJN3_9ALTE|nr:flagellar hook-basal body complex protein FliE [Salinimonas sediminis]AXR05740.1 flagellar hook-basal body complex protein FliE [Salinimonas sediminis]
MDIKADSLYQEMQAMIGQARLQTSATPEVQMNPNSGSEFSTMLKGALEGVNSMQMDSKQLQHSFEMGDASVSLADVMVAKEKAGIAFEATVQVRNKVLDAYKQIMNMPV